MRSTRRWWGKRHLEYPCFILFTNPSFTVATTVVSSSMRSGCLWTPWGSPGEDIFLCILHLPGSPPLLSLHLPGTPLLLKYQPVTVESNFISALAGWLNGWSVIPYTKRLWVQFPVRTHSDIPRLLLWSPVGAHTGGNQSMFLSLSVSLSSLLKSINIF